MSNKEVIEMLNTPVGSGESTFSVIFESFKIKEQGDTSKCTSISHPKLLENFGALDPFIRLNLDYYLYTPLSLRFEDGDLVHPLLLILIKG